MSLLDFDRPHPDPWPAAPVRTVPVFDFGTMAWQRGTLPFSMQAIYGLPPDFDPRVTAAQDGEWHAVVTLPHEVVEHEGYGVPAFEGDVERREWEAARAAR